MEPAARSRLTIQLALVCWAGFALGPMGADWLTARGVGEWPAVWVAAAAPLAGLLLGLLSWLLAGRPDCWRTFLLDAVAVPPLVLGMTGLVTGTATRGHLFVSIFTAVPVVIFLLVAAAQLRSAGNHGPHPDVVGSDSEDPGGTS